VSKTKGKSANNRRQRPKLTHRQSREIHLPKFFSLDLNPFLSALLNPVFHAELIVLPIN
jgi:hypothetical protein